jgi:hypothetical protein
MRMIIHELDYETLLARGQFSYMLDGRPTGAVESWRLTAAVDGYRFLRVDLDARQADSRATYLYHLTLDEKGRPVQLKFRYWRDQTGSPWLSGAALLEDHALIVTRNTAAERWEHVSEAPAGSVFWFPSAAGLGLLARAAPGVFPGLSLRSPNRFDEPVSWLAPFSAKVTASQLEPEELTVGGGRVTVQPVRCQWEDQERLIWLASGDWPVRMQRHDGLVAVGDSPG